MLERGERSPFQFQWPALNAALLATVLWWTMLMATAAGVVWAVSIALRHRRERADC